MKSSGRVRVEVDADLLATARRALGTATDDATITAALTDVLRRRQLEAVDALSRLPIDADPQPPRST